MIHLKVRVNWNHDWRHDFAYFESRNSIFSYIGCAFQVLVQIKIQISQKTELDSTPSQNNYETLCFYKATLLSKGCLQARSPGMYKSPHRYTPLSVEIFMTK